jgi:Siphovirus Gp157
MATLYEIHQALLDAMAAAEEYSEEYGGELSEALSAELDKLEMDKAEKIGSICRFIKDLRSQADAIAREADVLRARQAAKVHKADGLEQYLAYVLAGEKYEDATSAVSWRKSTRVEVQCPVDSLAAQYVRVVPEARVPDKTALKDAIKGGAEIAGVSLVTVNNIQVK